MDDKNGLTQREVEERIEKGLSNHVNGTKTKTIKEIVIDNVFTYFNILNVILSLSIIISGIIFHDFWNALKNSLFVGVATKILFSCFLSSFLLEIIFVCILSIFFFLNINCLL